MDRSIQIYGNLKFILNSDTRAEIIAPFYEMVFISNQAQYNLLCVHSLFCEEDKTREISAVQFFAILDDPRYKTTDISTNII